MPKAKFLIPLSLIAAILSAQPRTYAVRVNADGTFSPQVVYVKSGDTVRWEGVTRLDSIVSVNGAGGYPAMCTARDPYMASSLTGPPVFAPSGVYTLSPLGRGFSETTAATCPGNARPIFTGDNGKRLCPVAGAYEASLDTTWASQNNTGVFVRLLWSDVNPTPGVYDFAVLQREMDQAIRYGKVFSLGIKAGDDGTPDWIFSTNTDGSARANGGGGVPRLKLEDFGGSSPQTSCGKGDLLMVWNDHSTVDPAFRSTPKSGGKRTPQTVAISKDNGLTWLNVHNIRTAADGWYCYTAIHFVKGHVLLGFASGGSGLPGLSRMELVSFRLRDLR